MGMIPGLSGMSDMLGEVDAEQDMRRLAGIIDSMTPEERRNPSKVVDQSRRRRIAAGAGVQPHEVNELVKQFDGIAGYMKAMSGMGIRDRMRTMKELTQGGLLNPGAKLAKKKQGTGKRLTPKERAKQKRLREKEARRRKRENRRKGE
jgi:signal recognition particle subunit SRP54